MPSHDTQAPPTYTVVTMRQRPGQPTAASVPNRGFRHPLSAPQLVDLALTPTCLLCSHAHAWRIILLGSQLSTVSLGFTCCQHTVKLCLCSPQSLFCFSPRPNSYLNCSNSVRQAPKAGPDTGTVQHANLAVGLHWSQASDEVHSS